MSRAGAEGAHLVVNITTVTSEVHVHHLPKCNPGVCGAKLNLTELSGKLPKLTDAVKLEVEDACPGIQIHWKQITMSWNGEYQYALGVDLKADWACSAVTAKCM